MSGGDHAAPEKGGAPPESVTYEEIAARLGDPSLTLLNVLPAEAFEVERIPGSLNLPVSEVTRRASELLPDKAREIAVYCAAFT